MRALRRNIFSMNTSIDDSTYECDEFLIRKLDDKMASEKKKMDAELNRHISKMLMGGISPIIISIALLGLGVMLLCLALGEILEGNKDVISLCVAGAILLFASGIVFIFSKKARKPHTESKEYEDFSDELDRFYDLCARSLNVPNSAPEVEIYTYLYTEEKGVRKSLCTNNAYINETMRIFEERENLCIYCADSVWGVPIGSIEEIAEIKEDIFFNDWSKDTPYNEGKYSKYKIEELHDGDYKINGYYSIRFSLNDQHYEILVPKYEIEIFTKIINQ